MKQPRAWQRMLSGRRLDLLDPTPVDIEIEDIAHGLAFVARWNGQTRGEHAFSVAEHSVLVEPIGRKLAPDGKAYVWMPGVAGAGADCACVADGAAAYQALGMERSRGTQVFQLAGNIARGGIVELAFGVTLGELVEGYGGGTRSGRPLRAVQVGGPLGAYLPADALDVPMDYEALAAAGGLLGHGGIVAFDESVDMAAQARFAMEFCAAESCGKCTPCRIGSTRGVEVIDRITANHHRTEQVHLLRDLCDTLQYGSLCAMGGMTAYPVASALKYFPADFGLTTTEAAQ